MGTTPRLTMEALKRAFVAFMMEPVIRLCRATMNGEMEKVDKMLTNLEITLKSDERNLQGKHLMKNVFQKWINAAEALLEMIILKLPSPVRPKNTELVIFMKVMSMM